MSYQTLLTELSENIFTITINRPDKLNALNKTVIDELTEVINEIYDNAEIKSAIITGSGPKAFVAGADISEFISLDGKSGKALAQKGQQNVFNKIENCSKPIVAAVNGFALGGGCELAMACHFRLASDNAKFGQPEVSLGLVPGYGGTQRLPRLVGKGRALQLILTGDLIDAHEAYRIGLVNEVVPVADLISRCEAILKQIDANAPIAIRYAIDAVNKGVDTDLTSGLMLEAKYFALAAGTEDKKEGTSAFVQKRAAQFQGK